MSRPDGRRAGPALSVGVLAMFLLVAGMIFTTSSGAPHLAWVLSWAGFWLCGLVLLAIGMHWAASQRRGEDLYRRSERALGEDVYEWRPMAWPQPTASPPLHHRKAS